MGPGDDGVRTLRGGPRPGDAVGVDLGIETAAGRLGEEPLTQVPFGVRESGPLVARTAGVAAGVLDLAQQRDDIAH